MAKRVKYNKASLDSSISAAKKLKSDKVLYIYATHYGFTIENRKPPFGQAYVSVATDGKTKKVFPKFK